MVSFSITLRYRCQNCSLGSPSLKVAPTGEACRAAIPTCCVKCGDFEVMKVSMNQKEVLEQIVRLETAKADRLYQIDQKIEKIKKDLAKLANALGLGHPHPQLKTGIETLRTQIDELESDKLRHSRLLSEDLSQCQTHLSRLRENGLKAFDDRNCSKCGIPFIPLWPLPWERGKKKIEAFSCPKCEGFVKEEVMGV